jgi:hypothetical protein
MRDLPPRPFFVCTDSEEISLQHRRAVVYVRRMDAAVSILYVLATTPTLAVTRPDLWRTVRRRKTTDFLLRFHRKPETPGTGGGAERSAA